MSQGTAPPGGASVCSQSVNAYQAKHGSYGARKITLALQLNGAIIPNEVKMRLHSGRLRKAGVDVGDSRADKPRLAYV